MKTCVCIFSILVYICVSSPNAYAHELANENTEIKLTCDEYKTDKETSQNLEFHDVQKMTITGNTYLNNLWTETLDTIIRQRIRIVNIYNCTVNKYTDTLSFDKFRDLRLLSLPNLRLKYFNFEGIANNVRLRELLLDDNPDLDTLQGICQVDLERVSLLNTGFTSIPKELLQFKKLRYLDISNVPEDATEACAMFPKLELFNDEKCPLKDAIHPNFVPSTSTTPTPENSRASSLRVFHLIVLLPSVLQMSNRTNLLLLLAILLMVAIVPMNCDNIDSDSILEFSNKELNILTKDYFNFPMNATNINKITMEHSSITWISFDAFFNFHHLTCLKLGYNSLSSFQSHAPTLLQLDLSFNNIKEINEAFFQDYPLLEQINFSGNKLVNIDWHLELDIPLRKISLSQNAQLRNVYISCNNLQLLALMNVSSCHLELNTTKLETLDLRFANLDKELGHYCTINEMVTISYVTENEVLEYFDCPRKSLQLQGSPQILDQLTLPMDNQNDANQTDTNIKEDKIEDEILVETRQLTGCEFSTLKADYDDVILSKDEFFWLYLYFKILVVCVMILTITTTFLLFYIFSCIEKTNSTKN